MAGTLGLARTRRAGTGALGMADNGPRQRMLGLTLDRRRQGQHLLPVETVGDDVGYLRLAAGAGLHLQWLAAWRAGLPGRGQYRDAGDAAAVDG